MQACPRSAERLCRAERGLTHDDFEAIHADLIPIPEQRDLQRDELDYVLDSLKHDGYLNQDFEEEQRTQFASDILRYFWLRKTS